MNENCIIQKQKIFFSDDPLAESSYARLFPSAEFVSVTVRGYACRRYQLPRLHMGECCRQSPEKLLRLGIRFSNFSLSDNKGIIATTFPLMIGNNAYTLGIGPIQDLFFPEFIPCEAGKLEASTACYAQRPLTISWRRARH